VTVQSRTVTRLTTKSQRLLFRVLHAMSLYLPDTGYVQGMAALAATLLCYYEEDRAFVMLVRLWMFRGLERLYEAGFSGLMDALSDFETNWLRNGDVAKKPVQLLASISRATACVGRLHAARRQVLLQLSNVAVQRRSGRLARDVCSANACDQDNLAGFGL